MFNNYIADVEKNITSNPRAFWSFVKLKSQNNSYPAVLHYEQRTSGNGEMICNMFSDYFHSTFSHSSPSHCVFDDDDTVNSLCEIGDIEVDTSEVCRLLKSLDLNKSAGPDNIPAVFIVRCSKSISIPLCILFRRSLAEGIVPEIWKSAFITPIHKKGPKDEVVNYRPISKLCLFAKILEKIVYKQVYASIKQALCPEQHGFLRGRSTTSNLISCSDFLTTHMSEPSQVDVIYTDYSKCFDRIDHIILLRKLQKSV